MKYAERAHFEVCLQFLSTGALQGLEGVENIFAVNKRHLTVNLNSGCLSASGLIAKAADNLKILVHAGHHQQWQSLGRTMRGSRG